MSFRERKAVLFDQKLKKYHFVFSKEKRWDYDHTTKENYKKLKVKCQCFGRENSEFVK